jgi:hypothetical protein
MEQWFIIEDFFFFQRWKLDAQKPISCGAVLGNEWPKLFQKQNLVAQKPIPCGEVLNNDRNCCKNEN